MEKHIVVLCNMILSTIFCNSLYGTVFAKVCMNRVLHVFNGMCGHDFIYERGLLFIT